MAADAVLTPEGHGVRYGPNGEVIGVTIINARWLLERDGHLTIRVPHGLYVFRHGTWPRRFMGDLAGCGRCPRETDGRRCSRRSSGSVAPRTARAPILEGH